MNSRREYPCETRRFPGKQGFVLVLTLLVITALTGLVASFSDESNIEMTVAGFSRDNYKAMQMARSGIELALATLEGDENKTMDSLREDWSLFDISPLPIEIPTGMSVSAKIVDESSKLNVNSLLNKKGKIDKQRVSQFKRLFSALGLGDNLLNPLLDWLDPDDIVRIQGAESFYYMGLSMPYRCANGPLQTIGQIFLVKGMKDVRTFGEEGKKRLLDFLTIYSDGKVNINTAPKEVLESLSDKLDEAVAEAIIEYRKEEDFSSVEDLKNVPGVDAGLYDEIKKWITVKSFAFSIESQGGCCDDASADIKAVVEREKEGLKLIYWKVS